jgi:DNA replication protein DnaC
MQLKQVAPADDSAAVIEKITAMFQTMNLPRLADGGLYLGIPCEMLEALYVALGAQRSEDEEKRFRNRLRYAGIFKERTANTFKWDDATYPFAEPGAIENALTIGFVRERRNLVMIGPPGVGKTLLTIIAACKAVREGFSLKYKTAHNIAVELREARAGNSLGAYIKKLQACDVLVIEDLTFATFDLKNAQSFHSIIDGRYEGKKTTIVTSNANIQEWARAFPDKAMSSATLGRFYEDALRVNMNGAEDMRLKKAKSLLGNTADAPEEGGGYDG